MGFRRSLPGAVAGNKRQMFPIFDTLTVAIYSPSPAPNRNSNRRSHWRVSTKFPQ